MFQDHSRIAGACSGSTCVCICICTSLMAASCALAAVAASQDQSEQELCTLASSNYHQVGSRQFLLATPHQVRPTLLGIKQSDLSMPVHLVVCVTRCHSQPSSAAQIGARSLPPLAKSTPSCTACQGERLLLTASLQLVLLESHRCISCCCSGLGCAHLRPFSKQLLQSWVSESDTGKPSIL